MGHFVPHTESEIREMLEFIGCDSLDDLFTSIPEALRLSRALDIPLGKSESDVLHDVGDLMRSNRSTVNTICFAGGGAYDHDIPSAVRALGGRSEFMTAYTPYQPEVAQGVLQAVFEFQTMIARIAGLPIANASLYDGATATVEAINVAVAATNRRRVVVSAGLNPRWEETIRTFAYGTGHEIESTELQDGLTDADTLELANAAALVIQYPNYYGCLEDVEKAAEVAHAAGALLIVAYDPVAAGLLPSPGSLGADLVVGEGQPFGTALSFGGPYLGLFACREDLVRRLPGRLVGETRDTEDRVAYVTTLRTREQDIRREKASSNICTNQTLMAVIAAIHLSWLGTAGLTELATSCARGTRYLRERVLAIDGIEPYADAPIFREFAVRLPVVAATVLDRMLDEGFLAGIAVGENGILMTATERRTKDEIDAFSRALAKAVRP